MNCERINVIYNRIEEVLNRKWWDIVAIVVFLIYPFRHINGGLDLWDTGYSCANFMNAGLEHMDPMWFFSTFLANMVGNVLTRLPFGNTLIGLNAYSSVFVVIMALVSYFFLVRKICIPSGLVFLGEFVAVNLLCFPSIVLYNTLTYMFFLLCVVFLFLGITEDNKLGYILAGVCLGINVFVRFSNLPQIAIYAAGLMIFLNKDDSRTKKSKLIYLCKRFLLYLLGYIASFICVLIFIEAKYGLSEYVSAIKRLFEISEGADNYSILSMLFTLAGGYFEGVRRLFYIFVAVLISAYVIKYLEVKNKSLPVKIGVLSVITLMMLGIMTIRGFYKINFYHYATMYYPSMAYITAATIAAICLVILGIGGYKLRLLGILISLQMCIACVGSNTGMASGMNSMYMLSPFLIFASYLIIRVFKTKNYIYMSATFIITSALVIFSMQSMIFGSTYVFQEGDSGRFATERIDNNHQLIGIKVQGDRAELVQGLSDYVLDSGISGKEAIFYGNIPAMSFYLDMPAVFNPWPDLDSYGIQYMSEKMDELRESIIDNTKDYPVIIADKTVIDGLMDDTAAKNKWMLIQNYMDEYEYINVYSNDRFIVWNRE